MDASQDATGQVWAIGREGNNTLLRWDERRWQTVVSRDMTGRPLALGRRPDGMILCVWEEGVDKYSLSEHKGAHSKLLAKFQGPLHNPLVFADTAGNAWITEEGPRIYRVTRAGAAGLAYTIAKEQLHAVNRSTGWPDNYDPYNPIYAAEDGRGRTWFWSNALGGSDDDASLRGVLIFDGAKFEYHETLPGLPDKKISLVFRKDERHVWLGVLREGLYEIDLQNLNATRVPEPESGAFYFVQRIFLADDDLYCVAGTNGTGQLWQLRAGKWKRLMDAVNRSGYRREPHRAWLPTSGGLWLGVYGGGAWFIPRDSNELVPLDWRQGSTLNDVIRLFKLPDGRLLVVGYDEGSLTIPNSDRLPPAPPNPIQILVAHRPLALDAKGSIWGLLSTEKTTEGEPHGVTLARWDGAAWRRHSLPPGLSASQIDRPLVDSLNRVWLPASEDTTAIFDPATETWQSFPDYRVALQTQLQQHPTLRFSRDLNRHNLLTPDISADGRICFEDWDWKVRYFDGRTWRTWNRKEITGDQYSALDSSPFFNRAGNLCVNIAEQNTVEARRATWEWIEATGWHTVKYERAEASEKARGAAGVLTPPACMTDAPTSIVRDNNGALWMTSKGQLFKAWPNVCSPHFTADERHPFTDGRRLMEVLVDGQGTTFLRTTGYGPEEWVIVKPHLPLPNTSLQLAKNSKDSVTLQFLSTVAGRSWFRWRLDDGPWSKPLADTRVRLDFVPGGQHRVEVTSIDHSLQIDPTPAIATFLVDIDPTEQVAALIAGLSSPEYSRREAAVVGLAKQPARALPALRAARAKANADLGWWIDAAIEAVEESSRKSQGN